MWVGCLEIFILLLFYVLVYLIYRNLFIYVYLYEFHLLVVFSCHWCATVYCTYTILLKHLQCLRELKHILCMHVYDLSQKTAWSPWDYKEQNNKSPLLFICWCSFDTYPFIKICWWFLLLFFLFLVVSFFLSFFPCFFDFFSFVYCLTFLS